VSIVFGIYDLIYVLGIYVVFCISRVLQCPVVTKFRRMW